MFAEINAFPSLKTLVTANMYGMRSTNIVHRFVKPKAKTKSSHEKYALAHVYITVYC